jgi:hypothetical protein
VPVFPDMQAALAQLPPGSLPHEVRAPETLKQP